jgi:hypothetical protein
VRKSLRPLVALAVIALIGAGCSNGSADDGGAGGTKATAAKFATCMRENGISDFPDPDAAGELTIDAVANRSSVDTSDAAFKAAVSACKDLQPSGFTGHRRSAQEQKPALRFAQCIRENGVKDFPDPTPDAPLVDTNRIPSAATSSGMSILNAAMRTCGDRLGDALGVRP